MSEQRSDPDSRNASDHGDTNADSGDSPNTGVDFASEEFPELEKKAGLAGSFRGWKIESLDENRLNRVDARDHVALAGEDRRQDIKLKRTYAKAFLVLVSAQLVAADAVFVAYAWVGKSWDLPSVVIEIWLAATLVELIGIVLVVTQYLFPRRNS